MSKAKSTTYRHGDPPPRCYTCGEPVEMEYGQLIPLLPVCERCVELYAYKPSRPGHRN